MDNQHSNDDDEWSPIEASDWLLIAWIYALIGGAIWAGYIVVSMIRGAA